VNQICNSPSGTNGQLVTDYNWEIMEASCSIGSEYYLPSDSKLQVKINGYTTAGRNIDHAWDASTTGSAYIINKVDIGILNTSVTSPENNDEFMANMTKFNITCQIDCTDGACFDVNLTIQGRDNVTDDWEDINYSSSPVKVNSSNTYPYPVGEVVGQGFASVELPNVSLA